MIKSASYYWVVCDLCGANAQEHSEHSAWSDDDVAEDAAIDAGFTTDGTRHHCDRCPPLRRCERCDKPTPDEGYDDRDELCETCHAADAALEAEPAAAVQETVR